MEQSKVHKACSDQAIPLTVVKKNTRQKHVVLEAIDARDLTPYKQSEIDGDDGVTDNKRVVVWLITIALYWLLCWNLSCYRLASDCSWRWWRWRRILRRNLGWGEVHRVSAVLFRHRHDWRGTTRLFDASHLRSRCCYASQVRVQRDWHQLVDEVGRLGVLGPTPVSP